MADRWRESGAGQHARYGHAQGPGGTGRATAFDFAGAGSDKTWIGTVTNPPEHNTGPHHHGRHEAAIYIVHGRGQIRWGERPGIRRRSQARETSSISRLTFRIRRRTCRPPTASTSWWCAATTNASSSNSISRRWASRRRYVLTPEPLRTSPHMTKRGFSANHKMRIYSGVADYGRCGPYHCPCRLPARHPT